MEPSGPAGRRQPCGRVKRTESAKRVPDIEFGIGRKGYRVGWNVNERIVGQIRFPQHSPARADCEEITNIADIERPIGGEIQQTASVRGVPFSLSIGIEGYDLLLVSVALYMD
jgi:hypothetical protein